MTTKPMQVDSNRISNARLWELRGIAFRGATQVDMHTHDCLCELQYSRPLIAQLLELAHKYASECAHCDGTGQVWPLTYADDYSLRQIYADYTIPCPDCQHIRDVIAAAESQRGT